MGPERNGEAREEPTLVEPVTRGSSVSKTALERSVVSRGKLMNLFFIALFAIVLVTLIGDGDRSPLAVAGIVSLVVAILSSVAQLLFIASHSRIRLAWSLPLTLPVVPAAIVAMLSVGAFSPIHVVVPIAIYVVANAAPRDVAIMAYVEAALISAVPMFAVATGLVPDVGRIRVLAERSLLLEIAVLVQIMLVGVFFLARAGHRVVEKAVDEVERAARAVNQREALLDEVNQDLDRALQGRAGRATGSVVGSWKLGPLLGHGGMGDVYEAIEVTGGRRAAVKLLPEEARADADLVVRFRREAEALRRLDHPHVVRFVELGDFYIAMEWLEGLDLAAILRKRRALPLDEVVAMVAEVTSALEAARAAEIVHRDVKPQNLFFVDALGTWKVLDFGLSKLGASSGSLTHGMPIGTPTYMAPEQIEGRAVDHRVDVFALALVAYRAITGRLAFTGEDHAQILFNVLCNQPTCPSELVDVPHDVDLALALGLAKAPQDRCATALELSEALASASRSELSEERRARARALLAKHGWGQRAS